MCGAAACRIICLVAAYGILSHLGVLAQLSWRSYRLVAVSYSAHSSLRFRPTSYFLASIIEVLQPSGSSLTLCILPTSSDKPYNTSTGQYILDNHRTGHTTFAASMADSTNAPDKPIPPATLVDSGIRTLSNPQRNTRNEDRTRLAERENNDNHSTSRRPADFAVPPPVISLHPLGSARAPRIGTTRSDGDVFATSLGPALSPWKDRVAQRLQYFASLGKGMQAIRFQETRLQQQTTTHDADLPPSPIRSPTPFRLRSTRNQAKSGATRNESSSAAASGNVIAQSSETVDTTRASTDLLGQEDIDASDEQLTDYILTQKGIFGRHKIFALLPIGICARLTTAPGICVATLVGKWPPKRCTNQSKPGNAVDALLLAPSTLEKLSGANLVLESLPTRINDTILCGTHRRSAWRALSSCIEDILNIIDTRNMDNGPLSFAAKIELQVLRCWIREVVSLEQPRTDLLVPTADEGTSPSQPLNQQKWANLIDHISSLRKGSGTVGDLEPGLSAHFEYFVELGGATLLPRGKGKKKDLDEILKRVNAEEKVTKSDKPGYIYVYTYNSSPYRGRLKIGRAEDPDTRMKGQWVKHPGLDPVTIYPRGEAAEPVDNINRLESLIHSELRQFRRFIPCCPSCETNHTEWFSTSKEHAIAVIEKWTGWMRKEPYERRGGKWKLKPSVTKAEILEICKPLPIPTSTARIQIRQDTTERQAKQLVQSGEQVIEVIAAQQSVETTAVAEATIVGENEIRPSPPEPPEAASAALS
jgi:T5orf172 domain